MGKNSVNNNKELNSVTVLMSKAAFLQEAS